MFLRSIPLLSLVLTLASAQKTCTVPFGGPGINDAPSVLTTLATCGNGSTIVFSANTTYNISTPINFGNLQNVTISILGNMDLPKSIPYVQSIVNATGTGSLYWFQMTGNNITLTGGTVPGWSTINAYGLPWWQAAPNTLPLGGLPLRPHLMKISASNVEMKQLTLKPIAWGTSLSGNNNYVHDVYIDASYDLNNPSVFPFNTDGWDVSGTNVTFERLHVFNGDDCVAVNNNAHNIIIRDSECEGGHGMSLSGTTNITNVLFNNITMRSSLYATRFKSSLNSVGNISDVTWSNIYSFNNTFGVFATGVYFDQNTNRGMVPGVYPANSTATFIKNFSWINISGTINNEYPGDGSCTTNPCWYHVANATNDAAVTLQLLNNTATNIRLQNINLYPIDGKGAAGVVCDPTSYTDGVTKLGIVCKNGPLTAA